MKKTKAFLFLTISLIFIGCTDSSFNSTDINGIYNLQTTDGTIKPESALEITHIKDLDFVITGTAYGTKMQNSAIFNPSDRTMKTKGSIIPLQFSKDYTSFSRLSGSKDIPTSVYIKSK